jgi:hypothetical protein
MRKNTERVRVDEAVGNPRIDRPRQSGRPSWLPAVAAAAIAAIVIGAGAGAGGARAASDIEGVWSFNGGRVAIQAQPDGEFIGTVVAPTTFALCVHAVGEQMWSAMRLQPDGSFWGLHRWYIEPTCAPNPVPGPTAWRVLQGADGARFLRVCFSYPGSSQPAIAPDGSSTNVTSPPCLDSALIAPLPVAEAPAGGVGPQSFVESLSLPSVHKCVSRRSFQLHLRDPRNDPLKRVLVTLRGHRVAVVRRPHTVVVTIDLKGLPPGAFTVRIRAVTVLGHRLSRNRTYHTCTRGTVRPSARRRR